MTIGFASRAATSTCALCTAGLLALAPAAATSGTREDPGPRPGTGPRAGTPPASLLYRSGTHVRPHAGAPEVPELSAKSWLVADAATGTVLAAHDAHRRLPPASTLKTLFALTVLPVLPAGIRHEVSERELEGIGAGSSLVGVAEDRTYRVSDLWNGVFLSSGNDAVRVLASLSGGWRATAERMQAKARALGARDTRVKSPDGYDAPGQVSSAFDLAVFGRAGLRNPEFARYCARAEAWFPGRDGDPYGIRNTNRLLTGADGVERYRGLIGVKNGYTSNAGHTLVAAARRDGRTLVVTVLNPRSGGPHAVYEEARSLLDWGFEAAGRVDPVGSLDALRAGPLPGQQVEPAAVPVARRDDGPGRPVSWTIVGAALLGGAGVALFLRLKWGPVPTD
ncbi:D-alanyl-D-alanine carboxypeptidase family protein [Streptomyces griseomycini]|uniref:D-alanyl-D-alanine carboxypeptidase (Penicillin-binding protein 5/6) n=1 Tax=Streptomyces griseomycini TaxID=66895 RepID=A0A7W7PSJ2_9ACTN|nr:D-alanyl-D-alanine carboxypeptidase [Streptomyces griseomycini]MBB4899645.1 D-alanyl-D-alanine carboxypeptidase (penicillin-binding protein 5/6) [Streptomyces griseomycini]GGR07702.1 D-alanyl-D-alanine carboxypeptidase [Streptomyces griseomycini]